MSDNLPRISIVTCSYQQGPFLASTLRSVLEQNYADLEYIVMDGGSTDESVNVIKQYANKLAHWTSEPEEGQTDVLIKSFKKCTGDILGWLCSDDLLLPNALQRVGEFFAKHPDIQAVYGDSLWIDAEGKFLRPKKKCLLAGLYFCMIIITFLNPPCSGVGRYMKNCGGLDTQFNLAMDSDLWERFSAATRIGYIPHYLSCMRFYPEQKTRRLKPERRREDAIIRHRRAPHSKTQAIYPALHLLARAKRILMKSAAGGYGSNVPNEYLQWVKQYQLKPGI